MNTHSLRKFNNLNVWVYDALTLELIDSFSSMQKAADYFNVDYRSLLKHGSINFRLAILEYCESSKVVEREHYYLDKLKPAYNICNVAGSSLGRVIREETRLKLRRAWLVRLYKDSQSKSSLRDFSLKYLAGKVDELESSFSRLTKKFDNLITEKPEFKQSAETR